MTRFSVVYQCLLPLLMLFGVHGLPLNTALAQRCNTCHRHTGLGHCTCCPAPVSLPPVTSFPHLQQPQATGDSHWPSEATLLMPNGVPITSGAPTLAPLQNGVSPGSGVSPVENPMNLSQDFAQVNIGDFQNVTSPGTSSGQISAAFGGGAGSAGVPSMIGDFFGGSYQYAFLGPFAGTPPNITGGTQGTTVAIAGGDRQFKFAENNSPFPQDRVFFNYHHFHNAVQDVNQQDQDLNRYTFGFEKTFLNGWGSFEIRTPFAGTVSASPDTGGDPANVTEFGNVAMAVKALIARDQTSAISVGLGMVLPTGDDFQVTGDGLINNVFRNESVHLQPFIGFYNEPSSRTFSQFFVQFDFAVNGSDLTFGTETAELTTQSLLMLDYSRGYWLTRDRCRRYIKGVAAMAEVHYTTTLEDQDYGPFRGQGVFVIDDRRDVLNLTGGLFFQVTELSSLKIGAVAPLRTTGSDKLFDSEIGIQFVRNF